MTRKSTKLSQSRSIPGIGPKSQALLDTLGVISLEQLGACDVFELYARLKPLAPGLSINFIYAVLAAQQGVHWLDVQRESRTEILLRLDDLGLVS